MTQTSTAVGDDVGADPIELLRSHEEREEAILSSYTRLFESCGDSGVRFLLRLLLDDERRHHVQLGAMLNNLESLAADHPIGPRLPIVGPALEPEMREATGKLLELERSDAIDLAGLRQALSSADMPGFFGLLVELMDYDTAKHIAILEFLNGRA